MVNLSLIYDKFAKKYEDNRNIFNMDNILNDLNKYINISQGKLLDLGCGAGEPFSSYFIKKKWDVIGVDYSSEMLKIANKYLPQLKTIYSDMTLVKFNINQFDLVIAIYSIFHIEKEKHTQLLKNIYFWLKKGGIALFTYACKEYTQHSEFSGYKEFMGEQLFYSHYDETTIKNILDNIGFKVLSFKYYTIADETFLWIIIQK